MKEIKHTLTAVHNKAFTDLIDNPTLVADSPMSGKCIDLIVDHAMEEMKPEDGEYIQVIVGMGHKHIAIPELVDYNRQYDMRGSSFEVYPLYRAPYSCHWVTVTNKDFEIIYTINEKPYVPA